MKRVRIRPEAERHFFPAVGALSLDKAKLRFI